MQEEFLGEGRGGYLAYYTHLELSSQADTAFYEWLSLPLVPAPLPHSPLPNLTLALIDAIDPFRSSHLDDASISP